MFGIHSKGIDTTLADNEAVTVSTRVSNLPIQEFQSIAKCDSSRLNAFAEREGIKWIHYIIVALEITGSFVEYSKSNGKFDIFSNKTKSNMPYFQSRIITCAVKQIIFSDTNLWSGVLISNRHVFTCTNLQEGLTLKKVIAFQMVATAQAVYRSILAFIGALKSIAVVLKTQ